MKSITRLSLILIAASIVGGCTPSLNPINIAGKAVGKTIGRKIAQAVPPPQPKIVPNPTFQGGAFCSVTKALGWPPTLTDDRLNPPFEKVAVATLEYGEQNCGWKAPP